MNNQEWQRLYNVLALSPERELFIHSGICGIDPFVILYECMPTIITFEDNEGCYIPIDNAIAWHLEESTYTNQERIWHSVAATEFQRIKKRFSFRFPKEIKPEHVFSDEFHRQVYTKLEREKNVSGMRELQKVRPDLFGKNVSNKLPAQKNHGKKDLYFIQGSVTKRIKIGISHNVHNRIRQIVSSEPLELLGVIKGGGRELEEKLHKQFNGLRVHNEWFEPEKELLDYIKNSTT